MHTNHGSDIICGDAFQAVKCLPDASVAVIITDPPYGNNAGYGARRLRIAGDEHPLVGMAVVAACYRVLRRNSAVYMFCGVEHLPLLTMFFARYTRFKMRDVLIWDKSSHGRGHGFRRQYECILVLEKGRPRFRTPGFSNVLKFPRVRDAAHPHAKPTLLIEALIRHSSDEGALVLDPFLGTGTTAVAAHRLARKFVGIEVEPSFCEIARKRLASEMGMASPTT